MIIDHKRLIKTSNSQFVSQRLLGAIGECGVTTGITGEVILVVIY